MKNKLRLISILLCLMLILGSLPLTAFAYYEEPSAEGNEELESEYHEYTAPVGVTMQRLTGNCVTEYGNLGDDFLFVIKKDGRYYAMQDLAAGDTEYDAIPAVDITAWIAEDGSLLVPEKTLGVAFWRYEQPSLYTYGMSINGRNDFLEYNDTYVSADGDNNSSNDSERTYSATFSVTTHEGDNSILDAYYWSENETSGTLKFNGFWYEFISSYNSVSHHYNVIVDLRSDGNNGQEFYFRYLGTDVEYTGEEVEGYLYYADCRHQYTVRHAEYDEPTCMLKGCEEYWYCEGCNEYMKDEELTEHFGQNMPIISALGHDWGDTSCNHCKRSVPIYTRVTNQADFEALADDTMFIIVSEYNGKYYAPNLSGVYLYTVDSNGDGYNDIHDIDDNGNGTPDYLEVDDDGDGLYDYLTWDADGNGVVDEYDHLELHFMICNQYITDMLYNTVGIAATEITVNEDGTFSHAAALSTIEFEMIDWYSGDSEIYSESGETVSNTQSVTEGETATVDEEIPFSTTCVKQFAIPNLFLTAPSMAPVQRGYKQETYEIGDTYSWGVIFYDSRDDYYYIGDEDQEMISPLPFHDVCEDGSVAIFGVFDDWWNYYDDKQLSQLRLRDYNGEITFVTGYDYELDGSEYVTDEETGEGYYNTNDTQACVYLYASQPDVHVCEFDHWTDNLDEKTHTGTCECGETQTEDHEMGEWMPTEDLAAHYRSCKCGFSERADHNWNDGETIVNPTCCGTGSIKYTCADCGYTKTEDIPPTGEHVFGDWVEAEDATKHSRSCTNEGCTETEIAPHEYSEWAYSENDPDNHYRVCSLCSGGYERAPHNWNEGTITNPPTEESEGEITYTCSDCGATYTETMDKLEHVHVWSDWEPDGTEGHTRYCLSEGCEASEKSEHAYDDGVVTEQASCCNVGKLTFTCTVCGHSYDQDIPATEEHVYGEWKDNGAGEHIHYCTTEGCEAFEKSEHTYGEPTYTYKPSDCYIGCTTYTCTICEHTRTVEIEGALIYFDNCELSEEIKTPIVFENTDGASSYSLSLPSAEDIGEREGYKFIGWIASVDGITYASGTEVFIEYSSGTSITFTAAWAAVVELGEIELTEGTPYYIDLEVFEIKDEGITYYGKQVFYVSKSGIYTLVEPNKDEEALQ